MKKTLYLLLLLAVAALTPAKAVLVDIPDANFRKYLKNNYASCFTGEQLETTCTAVTSETILNVTRAKIANLSGVEYFTNLKTLRCPRNQLTALPALPADLQYLDCARNQLTVLPALPASLQYLDCDGNQLAALPDLPASLQNLYCDGNRLTALPALPASLQYLDCDGNQLAALPDLPASLQKLYCNNNQLTSLPTLPASLQQLNCNNNQLTSLPTLPASLQQLNCNNNQLTSLPTLPASLQNLDCANNQLTSLPTLPASLQNLKCNDNQLTSLPALLSNLQLLTCAYNQLTSLPALPASLERLYCNNNQLTSLPALPASLQQLNCNNNQLTSLPTLPASLQNLDCANNQLDFADLEAITSKPSFYYSPNPQSYSILPATQGAVLGATLTLQGGIGGTLNVYKWYKDDVAIDGATTATYTKANFAAADVGAYKCEVTSTFVGVGTTTGVTITSSKVTVAVCSATINTTSLAGGTVGVAYTQTLTQTGVTGTPVWSLSAGSLPAGLSIAPSTGVISGTPTSAGTVSFTVSVTDGSCSAIKAVTLTTVLGTIASIDETLNKSVRVYPNPSEGSFVIDLGGIGSVKFSVRIYDATGRAVYSSNISGNTAVISLAGFVNSIYFLEITTTQGTIMRRISKI